MMAMMIDDTDQDNYNNSNISMQANSPIICHKICRLSILHKGITYILRFNLQSAAPSSWEDVIGIADEKGQKLYRG